MMSFGNALEEMKATKRVARIGWNGKGMWLVLIEAHDYAIFNPNSPALHLPLLPWIGMRTADGSFVPWLASQTDLLANDWAIVDEPSA